jgi:carbonic anhydrase/acetyltransferase-like protein (isoleucine patch superfamily)
VIIGGNAEIRDRAFISGNAAITGNAVLRDSAFVIGGTRVFGNATVRGDAMITGGDWDKSPLCIRGDGWTFNMASKTDVRIGHLTHPAKYWREHWQEIAAERNFPPELIEQYRLFFNLADAMYNLGGPIGEGGTNET